MRLIGSNPPPDALSLAERDARFGVPGFVDDVRPYLEEASFFLCPIRDGGGTKLKILTAMSMGMVVVAHPVACEGIDVTPGRNVFFATTSDEYIGVIRDLMADQPRFNRISIEARNLVLDKYSYTVIGRDLDRQYQLIGRV